MAKPFYSIEEVCARLGKSEDAVKGLVRQGSLREFRDAGKVFFKAEDVDRLAGGKHAVSDADDALPSLSDVAKGGTSVIG
ncbi:MAG TPA: helix-turn-helix domain-containing protein, partial [Phycisphaerae bacterium]|nr:helix-turn-helix domain-containing protein [Phycisphaerae bacterium]